MKQGFIFSLDAFVAFSLVMITVSMLIFTIGTPKPYYDSLAQAQQLAHDTLQVLATSSDNPSHGTYLEQMLGNYNIPDIMHRVAGGSPGYSPIIPKGYGFRLEKYEFSNGNWIQIYDSSQDQASDRRGKIFTKIQASATTFDSLYTVQPNPGESPFCYLSCHGYISPGIYSTPCNTTPCDGPGDIPNFIPGNNTIAIARLTVYA